MIKFSEIMTRKETLHCDICDMEMKYIGVTDDRGRQPMEFIHVCRKCQRETLMPNIYPVVRYVPRETEGKPS